MRGMRFVEGWAAGTLFAWSAVLLLTPHVQLSSTSSLFYKWITLQELQLETAFLGVLIGGVQLYCLRFHNVIIRSFCSFLSGSAACFITYGMFASGALFANLMYPFSDVVANSVILYTASKEATRIWFGGQT